MLPAVIPTPGSTVDQIATFLVAKRKSGPFVREWMYCILTTVAVLPIAAKAKIPATSILVRMFICNSQTMKNGRIPKDQSAKALTALSA